MAKKPTEQELREAAYYLWEQEGRPDGKDFDHWIRANAELGRAAAVSKATKSAADKSPAAKKPAAKRTATARKTTATKTAATRKKAAQ